MFPELGEAVQAEVRSEGGAMAPRTINCRSEEWCHIPQDKETFKITSEKKWATNRHIKKKNRRKLNKKNKQKKHFPAQQDPRLKKSDGGPPRRRRIRSLSIL